MNKALRINHAELKEAELKDTGVHDILLECLKTKSCLHVDVFDSHIILSIDKNFPNDAKNIEIFGDWLSPRIDGRCRSKGAQILSLFLFNFSKLSIPSNRIKTFGRHGRSIADLLIRNVFYSVLRGERVYYSRTNNGRSTNHDETFKVFRRNYIWIIKAFFKKESLNSTNLNEKIIYATHLGIDIFKDNLLDAGVLELHEVTLIKSKDIESGILSPTEFMEFRNSILSQLK